MDSFYCPFNRFKDCLTSIWIFLQFKILFSYYFFFFYLYLLLGYLFISLSSCIALLRVFIATMLGEYHPTWPPCNCYCILLGIIANQHYITMRTSPDYVSWQEIHHLNQMIIDVKQTISCSSGVK